MSKTTWARPPRSHKKGYPGTGKNKKRMTPFNMPDLYGRKFKQHRSNF